MKNAKILVLVTLCLLLIGSVSASITADVTSATSVGTGNITAGYNYTLRDLGETNLGTTYAYDLDVLKWTDGSDNATNCNETFTIQYGATNISSVTLATNETSTAGTWDLTAYDDIESLNIWVMLSHNSSVSNCSISSIKLYYEGGFSDDLRGLPQVGTDVGGFLTNLAPGVGAFILILMVFIGIVGIVSAITFIVRRKMSGNDT